MLKEVRFRLQHEGCWLQETTERYPGLMLAVSSAYVAGEDVVVLATVHARDAAAVEAAAREWEADPRIKEIRRLHKGPRGTAFQVRYATPKSILHHILEHTPVSLGVIRVAEGVEHYDIVGETQAVQDLMKILSAEGTLVVEAVRAADPRPTAGDQEAWSDLTDKQTEAVVLAYLAGYYQWPRDRTATALARDLGLSSSAYLDHLRQAEGKLLSATMERMRDAEPGLFDALRARGAGAAHAKDED